MAVVLEVKDKKKGWVFHSMYLQNHYPGEDIEDVARTVGEVVLKKNWHTYRDYRVQSAATSLTFERDCDKIYAE